MTKLPALPFLLSTLVLFAACGEAPPSPVDASRVNALLSQGKEQLARNEWSNAQASFDEILAKHDSANREAHFGAALANTLFVTDAIRYLVTIAARNTTDLLPLAATDDESVYLNHLISDAIGGVRAKFAAAGNHLAAVENDHRFTFRINSLPLFLTPGKPGSFDLAGEWDRADALWMHGLVNAALGLLDAASSVDLYFDFPRAHAYVSRPEFDGKKLEHLMSLVTYLLNDPENPNFLSLAGNGARHLTQAREQFGTAAGQLALAFHAASQERDPQSDDVLRFVDENGNARFDPAIDPQDDACARLAELKAEAVGAIGSVDSFAFFDVRLRSNTNQAVLNQRLFCLLQKLQTNLDGEAAVAAASPRINLIGDLLPLIDAVVSGISLAYPQVTFGIPVPEGVLTAIVGEIVGDSFEVDPYAFFTAGKNGAYVSVRALLPVWGQAPCELEALCLNTFAIEMECSPLPAPGVSFPVPLTSVVSRLDGTLPICKGSWVDAGQAQDASHFDGALAADGIIGYLPYVQFQDPSFHGLLYLNAGATASLYENSLGGQDAAIAAGLQALDSNTKDFKPATLAELNALFAALSANSTVSGVLLDLAK